LERVLVSGVSGPIGAALLPYLQSQGAQIVRLVRGPAKGPDQVSWDPLKPVAAEAISGFDTVIHLAGESVFGRWNEARKKSMRDSRVLATQNLAPALAKAPVRPRVFICASAIGFYGNRGDEILTEASAGGSGYAADLARDWEIASKGAADAGIRTVNLRIGLVLSARGGALAKMLTPFKLGLGGKIGSGQQWTSWIHVDDIVGAIHHALRTESISGPVNLVAANPVRNEEFTRALASVLRRPAFFQVPAFVVRLAFGQMGNELLLGSERVQPAKLLATGYAFRFTDLRAALEDLLG
jgi:uncharacterized protein (TIGR01777 family)